MLNDIVLKAPFYLRVHHVELHERLRVNWQVLLRHWKYHGYLKLVQSNKRAQKIGVDKKISNLKNGEKRWSYNAYNDYNAHLHCLQTITYCYCFFFTLYIRGAKYTTEAYWLIWNLGFAKVHYKKAKPLFYFTDWNCFAYRPVPLGYTLTSLFKIIYELIFVAKDIHQNSLKTLELNSTVQ